MAGTNSFDVTTGVDYQEVQNAVQQAEKEIGQRYDFKGMLVTIEIDKKENKLVLGAPDEYKLKAVWDVIESKLIRRHVPTRNFTPGKVEPAGGGASRQEVPIQQGLTQDMAREIVKHVKGSGMKKVQAAIQGETVRISSGSRDDLQAVIALLKGKDVGAELKFENFRSQ
ncbi:MAG: YajQ family cyclic di-GMP-binding protein [bacterium]